MFKMMFYCSLGLTLVSCKPRTFGSNVQEANVSTTAVKDQGTVGFCWSYATMALIEGRYKKETTKEIDLSEEYLGFWRIAEVLSYLSTLIDKKRSENIVAMKSNIENRFLNLEGNNFVKAGERGHPSLLQPLIKKYGIMPQNAFTRKFVNDAATQQKYWVEIAQRWAEKISARNGIMTPHEIAIEVLAGSQMFPEMPPDSFVWEGQKTTPQGLYSKLDVHLHEYIAAFAKSRADYDHLIQGVKLSLAKGDGAILILPITNKKDLTLGVFGSSTGWDTIVGNGAHAMLAVDYRNAGGKLGPSSSLEVETEKHPRELEEIVVKNSWGSKISFGESTIEFPPVAGVSGYFSVSREFLLSVSDSHFKGLPFGVLLPEENLRPPLNPY